MASFAGGCEHVHTHSDHDPLDNHTCHCSVCKAVTGQPTTHVAFFAHGDVEVDNEAGLKRQPFNAKNPDGPLEKSLHLRGMRRADHARRQDAPHPGDRPEPDGYAGSFPAATYHAFYDPATGVPRPNDGRPVHEGLRPISSGRRRPEPAADQRLSLDLRPLLRARLRGAPGRGGDG